MTQRIVPLVLLLLLAGCGASTWNDPYPASQSGQNILYSSFAERPKHLDPVQSYSSNEIVFTAPARHEETLRRLAEAQLVRLTRIGRVEAGSGVEVRHKHAPVAIASPGWRHR